MKGKIELTTGDNTTVVSALIFLRQGMNKSVKTIIETMMNSIAADTKAYIGLVLKGTISGLVFQDLRGAIQSQIGCLAVLAMNYPEVSAIITSHTLSITFEFSPEYHDMIPSSKSPLTFLGFFVKYLCYFFSFSVSYFLNLLVKQSETPIFVEYEQETLLLSSYNELIIFQEIHRVLEETLEIPEQAFKGMSNAALWNILCQISIQLISLPEEPGQNSFKVRIIQNLYSLCIKALKTYRKHDQQLKDETHVVYVFMTRLANREIALRTRAQLLKHKDQEPIESILSSKEKLHKVALLLKELYYLDTYLLPGQDKGERLPARSHTEEEDAALMKNYTPIYAQFETSILSSKCSIYILEAKC